MNGYSFLVLKLKWFVPRSFRSLTLVWIVSRSTLGLNLWASFFLGGDALFGFFLLIVGCRCRCFLFIEI